MKVKDLIKILQEEDPELYVYVNWTRDYEDHDEATGVVRGWADSGLGGGSFIRGKKVNAIEII